ncbi:MAG: hypothetical protein ABSC05_33110 [Candidatus Solibacter sp.]|jgi:hypothetical protein
MLLYHASLEILKPGQILPAKQTMSPSQMMFPAAEQVLEDHKPGICQSRLSAYFAALTPEQALVVKHGMRGNGGKQIDPTIKIYEVEGDDNTRCPMILVQTVKTLLVQQAPPKRTKCVATAYWTTASQPWYFIEVLAPEIRVVQEVALGKPFDTVWREVNDAYKTDIPIATNLVRGCQ